MRKINVLMVVILLFNFLLAQVITTEPPYPTSSDSIVIYFDATKAEQDDLVGYTGDVYTHTGVNTNYGDWQHVIGDWGNNSNQPKLSRIETNLYKLTIGYPRDFYDLTDPNEKITALNFVFRSADGNSQTEDIFLKLYEEGGAVTAVIDSPVVSNDFGHPMRNPVFLDPGQELAFKASAVAGESSIDSMLVLKNGQQVMALQDSSIYYSETIPQEGYGEKMFSIIAIDQAGTRDTAYFGAMVNPPVEDVQLPEGVEAGINYLDDNTAILALFAPHKEFIYTIGDFNDWQVNTSYYLKKDIIHPDSVWWWVKLENLEPGREYAFQYFVDGEIRVTDPYTEKILDPWNDQYIPETTYPDLKSYPEGKTEQLVGILNTSPPQYNWQDQDYQRPDKRDLVIYELLLRDFTEEQNYQSLIDKLDYLDSLGVTAIELMPVYEFDGNLSWGYNPCFYFAPDKYYGTELKLKEFIDKCHQRDIAVILDMTLNHSTGQSPFVRLYNEGTYGAPTAENPWFNTEARHPYNVFNDMNHESSATKYFVDRVNKFWIEEYHIDGYRFDLSKGFTQRNSGGDVEYWGQYDQSRIDILTRMANKIWNVDDSAYVILEHFADNDEENELANRGMILWNNMNYNYNEATMGWHSGSNSDFSWGYYGNRGWSEPNQVTYMESHDEERLMHKNLKYGNSSGDYDITELPTALDRMELAFTFFLTIPGPRMMWQFGEMGYDLSINWPSGTEDDRLTAKPDVWELDYYQEEQRLDLYNTVSVLNKLRRKYDVFTHAGQVWQEKFDQPVKRLRLLGNSQDVVVLGNFDVIEQSVDPKFLHTGKWYEFFSGDSINVTDVNASITLQPGEYRLYSDVKMEVDVNTNAINNKNDNLPEKYTLYSNYPNPFNASTVIKYALPEAAQVQITIYDLSGRKVKTLVQNHKQAGNHRVIWNGTDNWGNSLASGVYFYSLQTSEKRITQKMLLMK